MNRSQLLSIVGLFAFLIFGWTILGQFFKADFNIPSDARPEEADAAYGVWRVETAVLLRDTTVLWKRMLKPEGIDYMAPKLRHIFGDTEDACATGRPSEGPAYCPDLGQIEVDTAKYQAMSRWSAKRGQLAIAFSFAHQIGHHVQALRGSEFSSEDAELQADCFAGLWLSSTVGRYGEIDKGDLRKVQEVLYGHPDAPKVPGVQIETFAHATPAQRADAAIRGFTGSNLAACDPA